MAHPQTAGHGWRTEMAGLWHLMRPRQWIKNGFVLAALVFSGQFLSIGRWPPALAATLGFCLLSSTVYIVNDLHDVPWDRLHPGNRRRPLVTGAVAPRHARWLAAALGVGGLAVLLAVNGGAAAAGGLFIALNVGYTWWLKRWFLLDVLSIAAGFLLRTWAGAESINAPMSAWLFLLVLLLTMFLALGKRRAEWKFFGRVRGQFKPVLTLYTLPLLNQFITVLVAAIITTYAVYTYFANEGHHHLIITVPFVLYGLFRYLWLLDKAGVADNPDEILVADLPTLVNLAGWLATVAVVIAGSRLGFW